MDAASTNLPTSVVSEGLGDQTVSPNGAMRSTRLPKPAASEVRIRSQSGLPSWSGSVDLPKACRFIPTRKTIGIMKANWNFTSSARIAPTAAPSVQPRSRAYTVARTTRAPTESTWPQTAESKITPGLNRYRTAATTPIHSPVPSPTQRPRKRRARTKRSHAFAASARMGGILIRPPVMSRPAMGAMACPMLPSAQSTYR